MTRAIRDDGIATALWLAWAVITPIDWIISRIRHAQQRVSKRDGEVGSVVERDQHSRGDI